ncbi:hypothetical protein MMPV_002972 [Pyropia vietnamensis]
MDRRLGEQTAARAAPLFVPLIPGTRLPHRRRAAAAAASRSVLPGVPRRVAAPAVTGLEGGGVRRLRAVAGKAGGAAGTDGGGSGGGGDAGGVSGSGGGLKGFVPPMAADDVGAGAGAFVPFSTPGSDDDGRIMPTGAGAAAGEKLNINRTFTARSLSDVPQEYQARVRARLGGSRATAPPGGTVRVTGDDGNKLRSADALEDLDELPDDLDEMDDLLMGRGADNAGRVMVFGGWLDESVAGRKAGKVDTPLASSTDPTLDADTAGGSGRGSPVADLPGFARAATPAAALSAPDGSPLDALAISRLPETARMALTEEQLAGLAGELFGRGLSAFNVGSYTSAGELLAGATRLSSARTRAGGQYRLWLAQALDAAGKRERAREVLAELSAHPSGDVRKVAEEILYILSAPRLELDASNFVSIPTLDGWEETRPKRRAYRDVKTANVEKAPEPYTLEWYMSKQAPPPQPADGGGDKILLLGVAAGLAAMAAAAVIH